MLKIHGKVVNPKGIKQMKLTKTQTTIGILAIAAAGALTAASAATLSIDATSTLQAGTADLANCQTGDVVVVANTPTWETDHFSISSVNLSSFDSACNGKSVKVEVLDALGASLGTGATATVAATAASVTLTSTIDAEDVYGFAVVIF